MMYITFGGTYQHAFACLLEPIICYAFHLASARPAPEVTYTDEPIYWLTVEQYHDLIDRGLLTDEGPVELLEGVPVFNEPKNPPSRLHHTGQSRGGGGVAAAGGLVAVIATGGRLMSCVWCWVGGWHILTL